MRMLKDSGVEWIGNMPLGWDLNQAGQHLTQIKNKNAGMVETNLLSLSYGKVKRRDIDARGGLLPESFEGYNIVEDGDIVLRFTDLQNDQRSLRTGLVTERGIITSAYTTVRPADYEMARFLHYALHAYDVCKGFYGMGSGVRQGLKWQKAKCIMLPMPSIDEQRRIADYLDDKSAEIDRAIEAAEKSIEGYEQYLEAVITNTIWSTSKTLKLGYIAACLNGDRSSNYPSGDDIVSDGVAFLTSEELHGLRISRSPKKHITDEKYRSMRGVKVRINDIVYCLRGSMGNCALNDYYDEGTVASSITVVRPKGCDPEWLNYALHTLYAQEHAVTAAIGATSGNLSAVWLAKMQLPAVEVDEQIASVRMLDDVSRHIEEVISAKQSIIDDLKAYKQSLVYEVVTGKREV